MAPRARFGQRAGPQKFRPFLRRRGIAARCPHRHQIRLAVMGTLAGNCAAVG